MGYLYKPKLKSGKECRFWWAKYYVNGNPVRESTKTDKISKAREYLAVRVG